MQNFLVVAISNRCEHKELEIKCKKLKNAMSKTFAIFVLP